MQVWINGDADSNVRGIAKALDSEIAARGTRKLKSFVVYIPNKGENTTALAAHLQKLSDLEHLKYVALTYVSGSGDEGVSEYKINTSKSVKNTVIVYRGLRARKTFVNLSATPQGIAALKGAVNEMMGSS